MSLSIRQPAVAGLFYPEDAQNLRQEIKEMLANVLPSAGVPKAIIVPHAGYIYSGPVAASVYARLKPAHGRIRRVVLLGPSHRVPFSGLAVPSADQFLTPLGSISIDRDAIESLAGFPQVVNLDAAHEYEHSLEVQLPFLQMTLGDFSLVPIVVGDVDGRKVAEVLDRLWGGEETLIVISSDLSHYQDYVTAQKMDRVTSDAIVSLHPDDLGYEDACGRIPVKGLLLQAKRLGLEGEIVDLRNSGDTCGDKRRVVGYGAYAFTNSA